MPQIIYKYRVTNKSLTDIIRANGSPADAAIAAQFCLGVVVAESMGIGGGFFLTYYDRPSRKAYVLDAREKAPSLASENMFEGKDNASMYGGLAVAVPGEVRGCWELYKRFGGSVPWADLIEPTIKLCEEGIPVSQHMALALSVQREWVINEPSMSSFINPSTGDVYKEGEIMKRPKLVPTLRELQKDPDALYTGSLSDGFLKDLQKLGNNYNFTSESLNDDNLVTTNQRIVEAFKYAYAERTDLADEDFVNMTQTSQDPTYYGATVIGPESHGTDHLSVWGKDGSVIAMTSTINLFFGAVITSESTDVVLNDEMDDFSSPNDTNYFNLPPSPNNYIKPGKRPTSSMCPSIFTDKDGNVRLIIGASGGSLIPSSVAWTAMRNLWFGKDIKESVDSRRLHHQLYPMILQYEEGFDQDVVKSLEDIGHVTDEFQIGSSIVSGIALGEDGKIYANSDWRKTPTVDGV
ncbi:hypothetical protein Anas_09325 [Armadillidium nasatum]|uniref:Gamma-glutamyltranspeptidase 1 n=1 Tax=Armadillidium nasatum TaxID=96803 RepID=A0A5N5SM53_9CRUS|nr:hypothetical protein Anas_09325 [Armadillidium nasatum]